MQRGGCDPDGHCAGFQSDGSGGIQDLGFGKPHLGMPNRRIHQKNELFASDIGQSATVGQMRW